jgi:hypothetical protein
MGRTFLENSERAARPNDLLTSGLVITQIDSTANHSSNAQ